ncbi:hypothetical protein SNEBB_009397 [Seison nebaliae]|nr:hypothetical protein SNEBB_009397 [Seison nebaliae]
MVLKITLALKQLSGEEAENYINSHNEIIVLFYSSGSRLSDEILERYKRTTLNIKQQLKNNGIEMIAVDKNGGKDFSVIYTKKPLEIVTFKNGTFELYGGCLTSNSMSNYIYFVNTGFQNGKSELTQPFHHQYPEMMSQPFENRTLILWTEVCCESCNNLETAIMEDAETWFKHAISWAFVDVQQNRHLSNKYCIKETPSLLYYDTLFYNIFPNISVNSLERHYNKDNVINPTKNYPIDEFDCVITRIDGFGYDWKPYNYSAPQFQPIIGKNVRTNSKSEMARPRRKSFTKNVDIPTNLPLIVKLNHGRTTKIHQKPATLIPTIINRQRPFIPTRGPKKSETINFHHNHQKVISTSRPFKMVTSWKIRKNHGTISPTGRPLKMVTSSSKIRKNYGTISPTGRPLKMVTSHSKIRKNYGTISPTGRPLKMVTSHSKIRKNYGTIGPTSNPSKTKISHSVTTFGWLSSVTLKNQLRLVNSKPSTTPPKKIERTETTKGSNTHTKPCLVNRFPSNTYMGRYPSGDLRHKALKFLPPEHISSGGRFPILQNKWIRVPKRFREPPLFSSCSRVYISLLIKSRTTTEIEIVSETEGKKYVKEYDKLIILFYSFQSFLHRRVLKYYQDAAVIVREKFGNDTYQMIAVNQPEKTDFSSTYTNNNLEIITIQNGTFEEYGACLTPKGINNYLIFINSGRQIIPKYVNYYKIYPKTVKNPFKRNTVIFWTTDCCEKCDSIEASLMKDVDIFKRNNIRLVIININENIHLSKKHCIIISPAFLYYDDLFYHIFPGVRYYLLDQKYNKKNILYPTKRYPVSKSCRNSLRNFERGRTSYKYEIRRTTPQILQSTTLALGKDSTGIQVTTEITFRTIDNKSSQENSSMEHVSVIYKTQKTSKEVDPSFYRTKQTTLSTSETSQSTIRIGKSSYIRNAIEILLILFCCLHELEENRDTLTNFNYTQTSHNVNGSRSVEANSTKFSFNKQSITLVVNGESKVRQQFYPMTNILVRNQSIPNKNKQPFMELSIHSNYKNLTYCQCNEHSLIKKELECEIEETSEELIKRIHFSKLKELTNYLIQSNNNDIYFIQMKRNSIIRQYCKTFKLFRQLYSFLRKLTKEHLDIEELLRSLEMREHFNIFHLTVITVQDGDELIAFENCQCINPSMYRVPLAELVSTICQSFRRNLLSYYPPIITKREKRGKSPKIVFNEFWQVFQMSIITKTIDDYNVIFYKTIDHFDHGTKNENRFIDPNNETNFEHLGKNKQFHMENDRRRMSKAERKFIMNIDKFKFQYDTSQFNDTVYFDNVKNANRVLGKIYNKTKIGQELIKENLERMKNVNKNTSISFQNNSISFQNNSLSSQNNSLSFQNNSISSQTNRVKNFTKIDLDQIEDDLFFHNNISCTKLKNTMTKQYFYTPSITNLRYDVINTYPRLMGSELIRAYLLISEVKMGKRIKEETKKKQNEINEQMKDVLNTKKKIIDRINDDCQNIGEEVEDMLMKKKVVLRYCDDDSCQLSMESKRKIKVNLICSDLFNLLQESIEKIKKLNIDIDRLKVHLEKLTKYYINQVLYFHNPKNVIDTILYTEDRDYRRLLWKRQDSKWILFNRNVTNVHLSTYIVAKLNKTEKESMKMLNFHQNNNKYILFQISKKPIKVNRTYFVNETTHVESWRPNHLNNDNILTHHFNSRITMQLMSISYKAKKSNYEFRGSVVKFFDDRTLYLKPQFDRLRERAIETTIVETYNGLDLYALSSQAYSKLGSECLIAVTYMAENSITYYTCDGRFVSEDEAILLKRMGVKFLAIADVANNKRSVTLQVLYERIYRFTEKLIGIAKRDVCSSSLDSYTKQGNNFHSNNIRNVIDNSQNIMNGWDGVKSTPKDDYDEECSLIILLLFIIGIIWIITQIRQPTRHHR